MLRQSFYNAVSTHTLGHMCIHAHTRFFPPLFACAYTHTQHTRTYALHTNIYMYIHTHTHTHTAHTHAQTHTYTHICSHTHSTLSHTHAHSTLSHTLTHTHTYTRTWTSKCLSSRTLQDASLATANASTSTDSRLAPALLYICVCIFIS